MAADYVVFLHEKATFYGVKSRRALTKMLGGSETLSRHQQLRSELKLMLFGLEIYLYIMLRQKKPQQVPAAAEVLVVKGNRGKN